MKPAMVEDRMLVSFQYHLIGTVPVFQIQGAPESHPKRRASGRGNGDFPRFHPGQDRLDQVGRDRVALGA
jgi:hypothetical protein